jgi:hypothetical protein
MTLDAIVDDDARLSAPNTAKGRLQRALLERLDVHEREDTLPTSGRFLFYELVQAGIISKEQRRPTKPGQRPRRPDQDMGDALTDLSEAEIVPWDWIEDETRELTQWRTAPTVADYVIDAATHAAIDRWDGQAAPLILCESRSLAGTLEGLASRYGCPIASTNGQTRRFLISKVAPTLDVKQRVLYLGDWDWCGHQIEDASRRTLTQHRPFGKTLRIIPENAGMAGWERVALTEAQVTEFDLPVISKPDKRYRPVRYFDAVETEALGQARIVAALRARLDELMPEPLDDVLEREQRERAEVAEQLRSLGNT